MRRTISGILDKVRGRQDFAAAFECDLLVSHVDICGGGLVEELLRTCLNMANSRIKASQPAFIAAESSTVILRFHFQSLQIPNFIFPTPYQFQHSRLARINVLPDAGDSSPFPQSPSHLPYLAAI